MRISDWSSDVCASDLSTATRVAGDVSSASHDYAVGGNYVIRATLVNDDGSFEAVPLAVSVADRPLLQVTTAMIADGALTVRFSVPLADAAAGRTITLLGERRRPVAATIRYHEARQALNLEQADGQPLPLYSSHSILRRAAFLITPRSSPA